MLWTEKYRPQNLKDVLCSSSVIADIRKHIKSWKMGDNSCLLLCGPSGVGKTVLLSLVLSAMKLLPMYIRSESDLECTKKSAGLRTYKKYCIVIDDADTFNSLDGLGSIASKLSHPLVVVCIDRYATSIKPLHKIANVVTMKPQFTSRIINILVSICRQEGIEVDSADELTSFVNNGDIRQALIQLQTLDTGAVIDRNETVAMRANKLMSPHICSLEEDLRKTETDSDMLALMIQENYLNRNGDITVVADSADALSLWDVTCHTHSASAAYHFVTAARMCPTSAFPRFPIELGKSSTRIKNGQAIRDFRIVDFHASSQIIRRKLEQYVMTRDMTQLHDILKRYNIQTNLQAFWDFGGYDKKTTIKPSTKASLTKMLKQKP